MDLPKPPEDQELRNIIDKLAQFVARNGREFEQMTRSKQRANPKFAFLFGGGHFNYYQYKVTTEQAILKQKQKTLEHVQQQALVHAQQSMHAATAAAFQQQQQQLQEQIQQSEQNLAAQHHVLLQQQQIQVDDAIRLAMEEGLQAAAKEAEIDLSEAEKIMQPIIDSCTKDSISAGKSWIFSNAISTNACEVIANYLVKRITAVGTTFELKLHLVYLINDVLHHCVRKNAGELKKVLGTAVVPIFCTTSIGASEDRQQKLSKLLKLWESNNYFDPVVIEQLKSPTTSITSYQAGLVTEYAAVVAPITASIQSQYAALQKQHQDFVTHINSQIQALAAQALKAQQQQQQQPPPQQQQPLPQIQVQVSQQQPPLPGQPPPPSQQPSPGLPQRPMSPQPSPTYPPGTANTSLGLPVSAETSPGGGNAATTGPSPTSRCESPGEPANNNNNSDAANSNHPLNFSQPPPGFMQHFGQPPPHFGQPPPGFHPSFGQPLSNYNQPPPAGMPPFGPPISRLDVRDADTPPHLMPGLSLPDLSKPPPGFPGPMVSQNQPAALTAAEQQQQNLENLTPNVPYFELPAGLMTNLVKLEDCEYKSLHPDDIVLPPPQPPSERLLAAVELFYAPPSHDRPRNSIDGWEQLGLYEFFKAKNQAKKKKEEEIAEGRRARSPRSRSRERQMHDHRQWSPSPPRRRYQEESANKSAFFNRPRSKSRSPSPGSPPPPPPPHQGRTKSRSPPASPPSESAPSRSKRRSASRSPTPPSFFGGNYGKASVDARLDESNKGHQLLKKMGWGGAGLGVAEQGIQEPISGGDVRDRQDQYKGIGINLNDPFESFRKSKGQAFINRMKARAEEKLNQ